MRKEIALTVLLALCVPAFAQIGSAPIGGAPIGGSAIPPGNYVDLTFWRTLKLGTAAFVNPELAKRSATAYKYTPQILLAQDQQKLMNLIKHGKVAVGKQGTQGIIVGTSPAELGKFLAESQSPDAVIVTSERIKSFGDGDPIVTWGDSQ
jgi:hypothetical protein